MRESKVKGNSSFSRRKRWVRGSAVEEERPVDQNGMWSAWISRLLVLKLVPPKRYWGPVQDYERSLAGLAWSTEIRARTRTTA